MPTGLREIMDAMLSQIEDAVTSSGDFDVQVYRGALFAPSPPTVDFFPGGLARNGAGAAFDDISGGYLFTVRARVHTADQDAGQDLLLRFMDDTDSMCVAGALMADPTLNGLASSLAVRDLGGFVPYPYPGGEGELLGFSFTCEVIPAVS